MADHEDVQSAQWDTPVDQPPTTGAPRCKCRGLLREDAPPFGGVERNSNCPIHGDHAWREPPPGAAQETVGRVCTNCGVSVPHSGVGGGYTYWRPIPCPDRTPGCLAAHGEQICESCAQPDVTPVEPAGEPVARPRPEKIHFFSNSLRGHCLAPGKAEPSEACGCLMHSCARLLEKYALSPRAVTEQMVEAAITEAMRRGVGTHTDMREVLRAALAAAEEEHHG